MAARIVHNHRAFNTEFAQLWVNNRKFLVIQWNDWNAHDEVLIEEIDEYGRATNRKILARITCKQNGITSPFISHGASVVGIEVLKKEP